MHEAELQNHAKRSCTGRQIYRWVWGEFLGGLEFLGCAKWAMLGINSSFPSKELAKAGRTIVAARDAILPEAPEVNPTVNSNCPTSTTQAALQTMMGSMIET
jgi:hypothetical protein